MYIELVPDATAPPPPPLPSRSCGSEPSVKKKIRPRLKTLQQT